MAFTRINGAVIPTNQLQELPRDFPAVPDDVQARFRTAVSWSKDLNQWWYECRNLLQNPDIQNQITGLTRSSRSFQTTMEEQIAALQTQAADLLQLITVINQEIESGGIVDLTSILTRLTAIETTMVTVLGNIQLLFAIVASLQNQINGLAGGGHFHFVQAVAADTWTINHTLNRDPAVTVKVDDGSGIFQAIRAEVKYTVPNSQVTVSFPTGKTYAGEAELD